jgi:hypothetical protein
MGTVFIDLDLVWVGRFAPAIAASCRIAGGSPKVKGRRKTFATETEFVEAIARAGIPEFEYRSTIDTLKSGFKTFLRLTLEQAKRLDMIEQVE